ncbi:hypothetical protein ACFV2Q_04415 [Streptomyces sp. NPDC059650]|uniref:SPW repeat domain-containing protein n=1 Tax=Streptomyces sp. NPDC059650 TaxID=3346896 RepID=UPI0036C49F75
MSASPQPLTPQGRAHVLRQGFHDEVLGLPMFAAALALWIFPMITQDGPKDAQVNEALVGLVLLLVTGRRLYRGGGVLSDVVIGLGGLWMIASPFLLGLQDTAMTNDTRVSTLSSAPSWWCSRRYRCWFCAGTARPPVGRSIAPPPEWSARSRAVDPES